MEKIKAGRKLGFTSTIEDEAKKMVFNPLVVRQTDGLLEIYPELKKIPDILKYNRGGTLEQKDRIFRYKAIKYIVWLYSVDTILNVKPVEPLVDRKYKAADLAGFLLNKKTNEFPERVVKELFELRDPVFVMAVLSFLRFQKRELWSEIIVSEEQHYEAMRIRMAPASGSSSKSVIEAADLKKKLRIECKELMQDIRSYWDEFWEDNLDLKLLGQGTLYKSIEDRAKINTGV